MNASEYQKQAARTLIDDSTMIPLTALEHRIVWNTLGLAGEAVETMQAAGIGRTAALLIWSGQIVEHVKKGIFHQKGLQKEVLAELLMRVMADTRELARFIPFAIYPPDLEKELGDVCWYVAALCSCLEIDMGKLFPYPEALEGVFDTNIAKLKARFPNGWDVADAAARKDEVPA